MRTPRIYTEQALSPGVIVRLEAIPSQHLLKVLRLRPGSAVWVFNGDGRDYLGAFVGAERGAALIEVHQGLSKRTRSALALRLAQSICRGEKMDLVLQKATELGVHAIQPLVSERTEVKLDAERTGRRMAHWRGVLIGAAEQCGRAELPELAAPRSLSEWLADRPPGECVALDPEAAASWSVLPADVSALTVLVGPEGGLSERELDLAARLGVRRLRLGPRVLRTETAGLAALAIAQARFGDLG